MINQIFPLIFFFIQCIDYSNAEEGNQQSQEEKEIREEIIEQIKSGTAQKDFGFALIAIVAIGFTYWFVSFIMINKIRNKTFPKEWLQQQFGNEHLKSINYDIQTSFPDMGNGNILLTIGRYSSKLSYKDWWIFNNYQRVQNFQSMKFYFIDSLQFFRKSSNGFRFPKTAFTLGIIYCATRIFFTIFYLHNQGASNKYCVLLSMLCQMIQLGLWILTIVSAIKMFAD